MFFFAPKNGHSILISILCNSAMQLVFSQKNNQKIYINFMTGQDVWTGLERRVCVCGGGLCPITKQMGLNTLLPTNPDKLVVRVVVLRNSTCSIVHICNT